MLLLTNEIRLEAREKGLSFKEGEGRKESCLEKSVMA